MAGHPASDLRRYRVHYDVTKCICILPGDRLYIAGGLSTLTNAALDTTECYNFAEDAWETVQGPTLSFPVLAPKCVLVE